MIGISAHTGQYLSDYDHVKQSVVDILTTPIGSRVMRRDYGSDLPFLVDHPLSNSFLLNVYKATAEALRLWEPRVKILNISADAGQGYITLSMSGQYFPDGRDLNVEGLNFNIDGVTIQ